jgi:hypothetical protein
MLFRMEATSHKWSLPFVLGYWNENMNHDSAAITFQIYSTNTNKHFYADSPYFVTNLSALDKYTLLMPFQGYWFAPNYI